MNMTDIIVEGPQRPRDSSQRLTLPVFPAAPPLMMSARVTYD